jgi:hypothetical protein
VYSPDSVAERSIEQLVVVVVVVVGSVATLGDGFRPRVDGVNYESLATPVL